MHDALTEDELRALAAEWQGRLRLRDWTIAVNYARLHHLSDRVGNCQWWRNERRACVDILHPDDWPDSYQFGNVDLETVLVHELLHIVLVDCCPDVDDEARDRGQEQAIIDISMALVSLKREGEPRGQEAEPAQAPEEAP